MGILCRSTKYFYGIFFKMINGKMEQKQISKRENTEELVQSIVRVTELLRQIERSQARLQGLTVLQSSLLQLCSTFEQQKVELIPKVAAEQLMITPATLSAALKALERKKLVYRIRNKEDERSYILRLSTLGRQKAELGKLYLNPLVKILQPIPAGQAEELMRFMKGIAARLEAVSF